MKSKILLFKALFVLFAASVNAQTFKSPNAKDIALFPQQNEFRNTLNLSGVWKFKLDSLGIGEKQGWFNGLKDYRSIAVPGSWNDQFDDTHDYLGLTWYEIETYIPEGWKGQRIFIRVGAATYAAKIWINGVPLGQHEGGQLPFAFEINPLVKWKANNRITIQVENILKPTRVPTGGAVQTSFFHNTPATNYDFFPYSGLNRPVWLYTIPAKAAINDVVIKTGFTGTDGTMDVKVKLDGAAAEGQVIVSGDGKNIKMPVRFASGSGTATVKIPGVRLWSPDDPFLYTVEVSLKQAGKTVDRYVTQTGVRTITATSKQVLLNGKPIFLKGFGKHEDFFISGRGTALPVMIKDFSLMKWIGANSFRTSHYPYDEEYMNMADREGFLVIDEIPAVGLYFHGDTAALKLRQAQCKKDIEELINRDKNHPSVIMWSVANEPFGSAAFQVQSTATPTANSGTERGMACLGELIQTVKKKDPTRLATFVGVMGGPSSWLTLGDVVCINRYWGWYIGGGNIPGAIKGISNELDETYKLTQKPIMLTEFGADANIPGHTEQPKMYTEEYQRDLIKAYLDVADSKDFVFGMHVWCFADFKTAAAGMRPGAMNYKGVFTRDRQPKLSAFYLRSRWNPAAK
jgi:beta-glucuronidase